MDPGRVIELLQEQNLLLAEIYVYRLGKDSPQAKRLKKIDSDLREHLGERVSARRPTDS